MSNKKDYIISGISFPKSILSKIDRDRGPIPRSRFLVKLIELAYKYKHDKITGAIRMITKEKNALSDDNLGGATSNKTSIAIRSKISWI